MTVTIVPTPGDALALDYQDIVLIWETPELVALGQCLVLTGSAAVPYTLAQTAAVTQAAVNAQYAGQLVGLATENIGNVYFAPRAMTAVRQLADGVVALMADGAYYIYPSRAFYPTVAAFIAGLPAYDGGALGAPWVLTPIAVAGITAFNSVEAVFMRTNMGVIMTVDISLEADGVSAVDFQLTDLPALVPGTLFDIVPRTTTVVVEKVNSSTIRNFFTAVGPAGTVSGISWMAMWANP